MMSASATIATANRASVSEQSEEQKMVKKVAVSSFLGNFIEWFDYASYSYFATTIALVFFPSGNHTVAMLQTFGVFALSFVLRPIGALFWGNFGDKKGRKGALAIFHHVHVGCIVPDWLPAVICCDRHFRSGTVAAASHGAGLLRFR